jgi:hypothetical protein
VLIGGIAGASVDAAAPSRRSVTGRRLKGPVRGALLRPVLSDRPEGFRIEAARGLRVKDVHCDTHDCLEPCSSCRVVVNLD